MTGMTGIGEKGEKSIPLNVIYSIFLVMAVMNGLSMRTLQAETPPKR
jgi:hypothetical protein